MQSHNKKICQYPFYEKYLAALRKEKSDISDHDETEVIFHCLILPAWLIYVMTDVNFVCKEYIYLWSLITKIDQFIFNEFGYSKIKPRKFKLYGYVLLPQKMKKMPGDIEEAVKQANELIKKLRIGKEQTKNNQLIKGCENVLPIRL